MRVSRSFLAGVEHAAQTWPLAASSLCWEEGQVVGKNSDPEVRLPVGGHLLLDLEPHTELLCV